MKNETIIGVLNDYLKVNKFLKSAENVRMNNIAFRVNQNQELELEESIKQWANENNINLFVINPDDVGTFSNVSVVSCDCISGSVTKPSYELIDKLKKPNTVILIKNIDKISDFNARVRMLNIINGDVFGKIIADDRECNGYKKLDKLLFAIATYDNSSLNEGSYYELFTVEAKDSFDMYDLK